jgi:hypothetical protein
VNSLSIANAGIRSIPAPSAWFGMNLLVEWSGVMSTRMFALGKERPQSSGEDQLPVVDCDLADRVVFEGGRSGKSRHCRHSQSPSSSVTFEWLNFSCFERAHCTREMFSPDGKSLRLRQA